MKVKIKGLVFVGFAAAILSANAFATDAQTVTSKAYVDAKISSSNTISSSSTTTAPNEKAVYDAITAGTEATTYTADNVTIDLTENEFSAKTAAITGATDQATLTTGGQVATYVAAELADTTNVGDGTISATQNGVAAGSFTTNQPGAGSITIAAPDWDQATAAAADYIKNKPTISNAAADITGAEATDTKELPTTYAVQQYVQGELTNTSNVGDGTISATQNGVAAGSFTTNQSGAGSITIAAPDWDQATAAAADYIKNKPTISNAAADITDATSADAKELTTTYAVQQYVQGITHGNVLPAMNSACNNASAHCALVTSYNADTQVLSMEWVPTAQAQ